jgi:hypothetical protein
VELKLNDRQFDRAAAALTAFGLIAATGVVAVLVMRQLRQDDDEVRQQPIDAWRESLSDGLDREQLP